MEHEAVRAYSSAEKPFSTCRLTIHISIHTKILRQPCLIAWIIHFNYATIHTYGGKKTRISRARVKALILQKRRAQKLSSLIGLATRLWCNNNLRGFPEYSTVSILGGGAPRPDRSGTLHGNANQVAKARLRLVKTDSNTTYSSTWIVGSEICSWEGTLGICGTSPRRLSIFKVELLSTIG